MAVKIGINGFGRIGRLVLRAMAERPETFQIMGINDLFDADMLGYMLRYDSTQGRFPGKVVSKQGAIVVNGKEIPILGEKDPSKLPWGKLGVDVVVESTGRFTSRAADGKPGYDIRIDRLERWRSAILWVITTIVTPMILYGGYVAMQAIFLTK